jgi:hypothetical protein
MAFMSEIEYFRQEIVRRRRSRQSLWSERRCGFDGTVDVRKVNAAQMTFVEHQDVKAVAEKYLARVW